MLNWPVGAPLIGHFTPWQN